MIYLNAEDEQDEAFDNVMDSIMDDIQRRTDTCVNKNEEVMKVLEDIENGLLTAEEAYRRIVDDLQ